MIIITLYLQVRPRSDLRLDHCVPVPELAAGDQEAQMMPLIFHLYIISTQYLLSTVMIYSTHPCNQIQTQSPEVTS